MKMNPENPLVAGMEGNWHKIVAVLLHKLKLPEILVTAADFEAYMAAHPDSAVLMHDKADGLHLMLVTMEQAKALLAQERTIDATPPRKPEAEPQAPAPYQAGLTTDPTDPRLGHGSDDKPGPQNKVYLVLSPEERGKGFVRPLRRSYRHDTCRGVTTMGLALCETYARNPKFYGSTYCAICLMHKPVGEFKWTEDNAVVGS